MMSEPKDIKMQVATAWNCDTAGLLKALGLEGQHVCSVVLTMTTESIVEVKVTKYVTVGQMNALVGEFRKATPREILSIGEIKMTYTLHLSRIAEAAQILQEQCHGAANAAGWWVNPKTGVDIRDNKMSFDQKLLLVHSELSEAMEGNRKNLMDDKLPHRAMREVELADAVIRIFDMAGGFGMDLAGAIAEKMTFNAVRPDHKLESRLAEGGKEY